MNTIQKNKTFWFVCSNGVIWPAYQENSQWRTPYPCISINVVHGPEFMTVLILADDGEIIDEFVLWDSLINLVNEISKKDSH